MTDIDGVVSAAADSAMAAERAVTLVLGDISFSGLAPRRPSVRDVLAVVGSRRPTNMDG